MYTEAQIKSEAVVIAKRDGINVYANKDVYSFKYRVPLDSKDSYRPFVKGDVIGYISLNYNGFESNNGSRWIRVTVRYWRKRTFDWVRDNIDGYLRVEDDSFVLETEAKTLFEEIKADEKADIAEEIAQYTTGLSINQRPTDWFKDASGNWILRFANGATVGFEEYKKMSNLERAKLSINVPKSNLGDGSGSGTGNGSGNSFFTTTNILIGAGILAALGVVLFLIFRKNGNTAKR